MDRQIAEVQALATKYSKAELGRMVKMGLLDPQKAMMAGMMIDRIQKQNAQPPQTTVAEDVFGAQQPQPQQQPQPMQQPAGLETLPADNIGEYAGGGIVAFADGGEADDYAYGGSVHFDKGGKVSRYDEFATPYDELINKSAQQYGIDPIVYKRLLGTESNFKTDVPSYRGSKYGYGIAQIADIHGLTREQRADPNIAIPAGARIFKGFLDKADGNYERALQMYKGAISPGGKSRMRGVIEGILEGVTGTSPAQAAEPAVATTPSGETSSAFGRGVESTVKRLKAPFGEPSAYAAGLETYDKRLAEVNSRLGELGGTLGLRQQTPEQASEFEQLMKDRQVLMNARNNLAQDIRKYSSIAPSKKPAAATTETVPEGAPPAPKREGAPAEAPAAQPKDEFAEATSGLKADKIPVPEKKTLKELAKEQEEAEALMGVDKEIFNKIRQDYKNMTGKFEDRRNKAAGMALAMTGIGLFGARKGQEAEALSKYGAQALVGYMGAMDKLNENEDRLSEKLRDLDLAEQSYLRTKSEKALGEKRSLEREIRGVQAENAKLQTTVNLKAADFAIEKIKVENPPMYQILNRIVQDEHAAGNKSYRTRDALRDYQGVAKQGTITRDQAYKAWTENIQLQAKYPDFEQYYAGFQRSMGDGTPAVPPAAAVEYLRSNPGLAGDFDAKYGAGAAARALGAK